METKNDEKKESVVRFCDNCTYYKYSYSFGKREYPCCVCKGFDRFLER